LIGPDRSHDANGLEIILRLFRMSDGASFDMSRKVLMFRNVAVS